jgi:hypothetical protein
MYIDVSKLVVLKSDKNKILISNRFDKEFSL